MDEAGEDLCSCDKFLTTDHPCQVRNEAVNNQWRAEVILKDSAVEKEMTETMFNHCIQELRYRAEFHDSSSNGAAYALPGDIYKSDSAVPEDVRLALLEAVHPLDAACPSSGGMVRYLVDPSLFPLTYGLSKILPVGSQATTLEDCIERTGEGEVIPTPVARFRTITARSSSGFLAE
ncbi:hypothetical protein NMY22_g17596 [Coprinellus aureogranulatus]|nr:hypothetical protein NMY22_g17596 [Coprinellus aureogranulatus]